MSDEESQDLKASASFEASATPVVHVAGLVTEVTPALAASKPSADSVASATSASVAPPSCAGSIPASCSSPAASAISYSPEQGKDAKKEDWASLDESNSENKPEKAWRNRIKELRQYKEEHGNCLVPARYPTNRKLGHWVMTQRRQHVLLKEGKPSSLCEERVEELNELGFAWKIREKHSCMWSQRLEELGKYKEQHGDCLVPQRYPPNPSLGTWVNTQRRHFKLFKANKPSIMTKARIAALEALGFDWHPKETWKKNEAAAASARPRAMDVSITSLPGTTSHPLSQALPQATVCDQQTRFYERALSQHYALNRLDSNYAEGVSLSAPTSPVSSRVTRALMLMPATQLTRQSTDQANMVLLQGLRESAPSVCHRCGKVFVSSTFAEICEHDALCARFFLQMFGSLGRMP